MPSRYSTASVISLCEYDLRSITFHLQNLDSSHSNYKHRNSHLVRYMYHCAQIKSRQHKSKKADDEDKHRDKHQMAMFPCGGWLHITVDSSSSDAMVKLAHKDDHVPYYSRDVPVKVKEFVTQNPRLRAAQVSSTNRAIHLILSLSVIRFGIGF